MKDILKSKYFKWGLTALIVIILSICFYYAIFMSHNISSGMSTIITIIMPIVDGLAIGYIATPILNKIEKKILIPLCTKLKIDSEKRRVKKYVRALSIFLTLVFIVLIVYTFFAIVIPQIFQSIQSIIRMFPTYINNLITLVDNLINNNPELEKYVNDILKYYAIDVEQWLNSSIMPMINNIIKSVSLSVIGLLKALYNLIIGFIISVYVLGNKEKFASQAKKIAYAFFERNTANEIIRTFRFINKTFIGFLGGKIVDSAIIGVLCFLGTTFMGTPYALLISVIVGVTNIIPFFGPYIGAIPSIFLILMVDPLKALYFAIFILVLQQLDGNVIGPKILGESTGLSGFWVIFSITLFGGLWGLVGMLVGVPTFAVFYAIVSASVNRMLEKKKMDKRTEVYENLDYISKQGEYITLDKEEIVK